MSGIYVGTRLDRLRELRRKVDVAIELAERELGRGDRPHRVAPVTTSAPRQGSSPVLLVRVPVDQVRPPVIRDWAVTSGLPVAAKACLPVAVVQAFSEAHQ